MSDHAEIDALIRRWAEAVHAGDDVAFAHALLRCGMPDELREHPGNRLRLTIGLRKVDGRWLVTHEHHSFPDRS